MLEIFQEMELPKLSETSLYQTFNQTSDITKGVVSEVTNSKETVVSPDALQEIIALIRLNGTVVAKRAVDAYLNGQIVIIYNKATSKVPGVIPYIVLGKNGKYTAYIFADKVVNKINSSSEYTNLMAVMEAAYVSLMFNINPNKFLMNSELMLTLCNIYAMMVAAPLEQFMNVKGENLNKVMLYTIAHFYKMIRGDAITETTIPLRRLMRDQIDPGLAKQIIDDVAANDDGSFMGLVRMFIKINPVRYAKLEEEYLNLFNRSCGYFIMFALEHIPYLFLLASSSTYKTRLTTASINNLVSTPCKKVQLLLATITNEGGSMNAGKLYNTESKWRDRASAN